MISHMGNKLGFRSGNDPGVVGCSDVVSLVGCLSVNTSPGMIRGLLRHNKS